MGKIVDLLGRTFGDLYVADYDGVDKNHHTTWYVQCACGNSFTVRGDNLTTGRVSQCIKCALPRRQIKRWMLDAWYHVTLMDTVTPHGMGYSQGTAGFCVVTYRIVTNTHTATIPTEITEPIAPAWITAPQRARDTPAIVVQTVRRLIMADEIPVADNHRGIHSWLKTKRVNVVHHSFNEGQAVWEKWLALTGEWRGPK
jgi:hypothetical protein